MDRIIAPQFLCNYVTGSLTEIELNYLATVPNSAEGEIHNLITPADFVQASNKGLGICICDPQQALKNASHYFSNLGVPNEILNNGDVHLKKTNLSSLDITRNLIKHSIDSGNYEGAREFWDQHCEEVYADLSSQQQVVYAQWSTYLSLLFLSYENQTLFPRYFDFHELSEPKRKDLLDYLGKDIVIEWGSKSLDKRGSNSVLAGLIDLGRVRSRTLTAEGIDPSKAVNENDKSENGGLLTLEPTGLARERILLLYAALHNEIRMMDPRHYLRKELPKQLKYLIDIYHIPNLSDARVDYYRRELIDKTLCNTVKLIRSIVGDDIHSDREAITQVTFTHLPGSKSDGNGTYRSHAYVTKGQLFVDLEGRLDFDPKHLTELRETIEHEYTHNLTPNTCLYNEGGLRYLCEGIAQYFENGAEAAITIPQKSLDHYKADNPPLKMNGFPDGHSSYVLGLKAVSLAIKEIGRDKFLAMITEIESQPTNLTRAKVLEIIKEATGREWSSWVEDAHQALK